MSQPRPARPASPTPDLLVIGAGSAGLSAARTAIRLGRSVVLVTDGPPGGDCTFTGCVPSKTLLAARHLPFDQAIARVHGTVAAVAAEESVDVLRAEGMDVALGRAIVTRPGRVEVNDLVFSPKRMVLATGSHPAIPDVQGLPDVPYLTTDSLFSLAALPTHLAVLGGGAIGAEMAQAFRSLGSEVTVIEAADRLLPNEEPEASTAIASALSRNGVDVRTGATLRAVTGAGTALVLHTDAGTTEASHLLVAVGREPSTAGFAKLGLRLAGNGGIEVDDRMRTSVAGIYAAGDVTTRLPFTHAAHEMGRIAATNALRRIPTSFSERAVPWVTFTSPEVARVGLTEAQAAERVQGARVIELPMTEVDRARTSGQTDGFVKIIVGPRLLLRNAGGGKVLGATIVAERAGEMIAELALAMRTGMFTGRLAQTSHAYPTWSVGVQQAVAQLFGYGDRRPRPARRLR